MRIEYGCELSLVVTQPTPAFCLVDIHPERRDDILEEKGLAASPRVSLSDERDGFGNRLRRFVAPTGEATLSLSGMVADSGVPESRNAASAVLDVAQLPTDVLTYLTGSRYCETDKLGAVAWNTFGHLPRSGGLIQAVCDFTNERIAFDYQSALDPHCAGSLRRTRQRVP